MTLLTDKQKLDIIDGFKEELDKSVEDRRTNPDWRVADTKTKLTFLDKQFEDIDKIWLSEMLEHLGVNYEFI